MKKSEKKLKQKLSSFKITSERSNDYPRLKP